MAYSKQTWADGPAGGTPITAAELNRMENGIADLNAKDTTLMAVSGDQTAAVNAFLSAVSPVGAKRLVGSFSINDTLSVPSGTYLDLTQATITQTGTSKITLDLNGVANVTVLGGTFVGTGVHIPGSTVSIGVAVRPGSNNVRIVRATLTGHGGAGIKVDASTDVWVESCTVVGTSPPSTAGSDASQFGILIEGTSTRVAVSDCNISATSQGIISAITSNDVSVHGNRIWGITGQHGMYLQTYRLASIIGNTVNGTAYIGIKVQVYNAASNDIARVVVADNVVYNTGDHGIFIGTVDSPATRFLREVTVTGNVVIGTGSDGINLAGVVSGKIADNQLGTVGRHGISIKECTDLDITDNNVNSCVQMGILIQATGTVDRIRLDGNTIRNPATGGVTSANYGIWVNLGNDITIARNIVTASHANMRYGIYFAGGDQASASFIGNYVSGAADYPVRLLSGTAVREWTNNSLVAGSLGTILNSPTSGRGSRASAYFGTAAPTSGAYQQGDVVWSTAPTAGGTMGWVCVAAGSPGTWKTFGSITA